MKAAQINQYGGPEVLTFVSDAPKPPINPDQVLVEVHAAGVNPFDWKVRAGMVQMAKLAFPATLGGDLAGIVVAIGDNVVNFKVGDAVYGQAGPISGNGAFAEFAPVSAASLGSKPASTDFIAAASLPLAGVSAYQALVETLNVKPGQKILIHGGAGGIGSLAIQLAAHLEAHVATTVRASSIEFVKGLGAEIAIDYETQAFDKRVSGYDAVFDTIGGSVYNKSFVALKPGGAIVSMTERPNEELMKRYRVAATGQYSRITTERLAKLAELVDSGAITPQVDKTFPLDRAGEALGYLQTGRPHGKVVISVRN